LEDAVNADIREALADAIHDQLVLAMGITGV
jgi:hypothetical protein